MVEIGLANRFVLMFFCFIESDIGIIDCFLELAEKGNVEVVFAWLTQGMAVDIEGFDGSTSIMFAGAGNNTKIVHLLLESGANVNKQNNKKWTALHYAAELGHTNVIKKPGTSTNIKDDHG